jgi:hypothetical protein
MDNAGSTKAAKQGKKERCWPELDLKEKNKQSPIEQNTLKNIFFLVVGI